MSKVGERLRRRKEEVERASHSTIQPAAGRKHKQHREKPVKRPVPTFESQVEKPPPLGSVLLAQVALLASSENEVHNMSSRATAMQGLPCFS